MKKIIVLMTSMSSGTFYLLIRDSLTIDHLDFENLLFDNTYAPTIKK